MQFLTLQLLPYSGKGGLAPARDKRPIQVLEATPPGISGLSLGINSLDLEGGGGGGGSSVVLFAKQETTN